jgi:hypothetical protein
MGPVTPTLLWERHAKKIHTLPESGCWIWMGALTKENGYGYVWDGVATSGAHRAFFAAYHGPIPSGMHLDHICRTPSCVNPDHLRTVTPRENVVFNSQSTSARNLAKTHCSKCGGDYRRQPNGWRVCDRCKKNYDHLKHERAKLARRNTLTGETK